jgi:phytoene dehydrogenase-like protein
MAQHYDVAVIGGEPGTFVAALMLARSGRRVVLVQHDAPSFSEPCYPGSEASCISRWHDALGITPPPTRRQGPRAPLQVVLPHQRLTLGGGREALAQELKREFPHDAQAIDDLLQRLGLLDRSACQFLFNVPSLPPETLQQRFGAWRLGRELGPLRGAADAQALDGLFGALDAAHPIRRLFLAGLPLLGDSVQTTPSLFLAVHRLAQTFLGQPADPGSRAELVELLADAAQRAGIEVRREARVKRMALSGKRASHLELVGERHDVRADWYLYGGREPLGQLWPNPSDPLVRQEAQSHSIMAGGWLMRRWLVPKNRVNAALGPLCWVLDGRAQGRGETPYGDEPFVLQRHDEGERVALQISAPLLGAEPTAGDNEGQAPAGSQGLWQRMEPRLRRVLPHLPRDGAGLGPLQRTPQPLFAAAPRSHWGVTGRSRKTPVANVVYCGRDVVPGLGLEGEYLAASGAVALLRQRARWR